MPQESPAPEEPAREGPVQENPVEESPAPEVPADGTDLDDGHGRDHDHGIGAARETGPPRYTGAPPPEPRSASGHSALRSLLGAWALHACSPAETEAVERHLTGCDPCHDEAARLRDAVRWLSPADPLDLDPSLRAQVLEACLRRRPARVPVPDWAAPYTAETARLDALLGSLNADEWDTAVRLVWTGGARAFSVSGVLAHLAAVDGLVSTVLGLADPLGEAAPLDPLERTEAFGLRHTVTSHDEVRALWRRQTHAIVSTAAFAGSGAGQLGVDYGGFELPMRESFLDRAFECWIHADDIARAVDYPYDPPAPEHLGAMIGLAARLLPLAVAGRRRDGLAGSRGRLVEAGTPGRSVRLEIEGPGGGDFYIPLDSPAAVPARDRSVGHIALDGVEFCHLMAGHRDPERIAAGVKGDPAAIRDVLYAAASMSRL